jgi:hypothetical protein
MMRSGRPNGSWLAERLGLMAFAFDLPLVGRLVDHRDG